MKLKLESNLLIFHKGLGEEIKLKSVTAVDSEPCLICVPHWPLLRSQAGKLVWTAVTM